MSTKHLIHSVLIAGIMMWCQTLRAATSLPDSLFSRSLYTQEKVYVHLDNNCYFQGDTIWYKAYVVKADTYEPLPQSRILYVELMDEQGYLVERQQLVVDEGGNAHGQFALPDSAFAGYYEIRAYTKWMLNFGYEHEQILPEKICKRLIGGEDDERKLNRNYFGLFSRVVAVYNRPAADTDFRNKQMPLKVTMGDYERRYLEPPLNMKFYPEGGYIIAGATCRVAWEATNEQLKRIDIEGELLEGDSTVMKLKGSRAGRGMLEYTFKAGKDYHVHTTYNGTTYTFDLPAPQAEGVALRVETSDEAVTMKIETRFDSLPELYVSVISGGHKVCVEQVNGPEIVFDINDMPCGVCQATVFDTDGTVYADRLFFADHTDQLKANAIVGIDTAYRYKPYEKIRIPLLLTDHRGRPLREQTVSVSVRDRLQLDPTFATGNILTNLLLESDIKGFIENPDQYFDPTNTNRQADLDLLMMIQGWRRYDWKEVATLKRPKLDYKAERKMYIYGETRLLRGKLAKTLHKKSWSDITLTAQIINDTTQSRHPTDANQLGIIELDSEGHFKIQYDPFYEKSRLILRALFTSQREKGVLQKTLASPNIFKSQTQFNYYDHDSILFIRKEYFFPICVKQLSWYETNQPLELPGMKLTWDDYQRDIYAAEWIPEVRVTAERQHARHRRDKPVQVLDFYDFFNDITDMGYHLGTYNFANDSIDIDFYEDALFAYQQHQNPHSKVNKEKGWLYLNWKQPWEYNQQYAASSMSYLLHNIYNLATIKKLYIITDNSRRPSTYELHHLDGWSEGGRGNGLSSYINISLSQSDRTERFGREYILPGFNRPAEFYSPDYSHAAPPDPTTAADHRRTLYWNPEVKTDKYGQAYIELYNSSVCQSLDVEVEGLTKYGEFIVNERRLP